MSNPVKVLVVISNLSHGGAERQIVELANRINRDVVDLHLCSLSHHMPLKEYLKHPDKLHVIEKHKKYDLGLILRLARFLRRERFDVVHGFLFDAEIASRLAGVIARTPMIVGSERNSRNHFSRLKTAIYKYTAPCIDVCVANSKAGMEFSHRVFGIPKNKYRVIRNGVDTVRFSPGKSAINRAEWGLPDSTPVVGIVASYKRQKNHSLLLRAAADLGGQDFRLLFVGSAIREGSEPTAAYFESIQALVDDLGIRDKCVFMEARNDVEEVYRLCDITVLPSLFEGTPNVALESMS
ncbi:MAG: glycosyltransferase, partial [Ketobacteraceae bacterium]|nr:glycosyltransferase [Ketobacteraceae bacterium]